MRAAPPPRCGAVDPGRAPWARWEADRRATVAAPRLPEVAKPWRSACVCGRRVADGGDGGGCVSPQQARAEQEEEFISNTLFKKIQALQKEKETLAVNYEKEEEFLTNELSRKLMQVSGGRSLP